MREIETGIKWSRELNVSKIFARRIPNNDKTTEKAGRFSLSSKKQKCE